MKDNRFSALHLDYQSREIHWTSNTDVSIPISDSLAFTRSGSFFTSALISNGKNGPFLLMKQAHFNRLLHSYKSLYENDLKLTFSEFSNYIDALIARNMEAGIQTPYQLLIYALGGAAESFAGYSSGLCGHLKRIVFVSVYLARKPDWTFQNGINLLALPTQRLLADAKPTNYVSGLKAQHAINAINCCVLKDSSDATLDTVFQETLSVTKDYLALTESEKLLFRIEHNRLRASNPVFLKKENELYPKLMHESLFTSQDNYILEGPTFSVFGISQKNEIYFIPLQGNGQSHRDDNEGKILHGTSIQWIEAAAKKHSMPIRVTPLHYDEIWNLKSLFAVSCTRIDIAESTVRLQQIASINGKEMTIAPATDPFISQLCQAIFETDI